MAVVGYETIGQYISAEVSSVLQSTIDQMLKDPNAIKRYQAEAERLYYTGSGVHGGYVKTLPGWSAFMKECKGDWQKAYFLSAIDNLADIAWIWWGKAKKPEWETWKENVREIYNQRDYSAILDKLAIISPKLTVPAPTPAPTEPARAGFLGFPRNLLLILGLGGAALLLFTLFRRGGITVVR